MMAPQGIKYIVNYIQKYCIYNLHKSTNRGMQFVIYKDKWFVMSVKYVTHMVASIFLQARYESS